MPRTGHVASIRRSVGSQRLLLPSATICIFDTADRLLLLHHADGDHWAPPGGAIEPDESPADAAVRECFEETGLHVRPVQILGVYGGPPCEVTYDNGDVVQYVLTLFRCEVIGGALRPDGHEALDARYVAADEWQELTVPAWARIALPRVFDDIAAGTQRAAFVEPTWHPDNGWYVTDVRHRRLAGPFATPDAPEADEAIRRLYAELGGGCCDLQVEWLDVNGLPVDGRSS